MTSVYCELVGTLVHNCQVIKTRKIHDTTQISRVTVTIKIGKLT